MEKTELLACPFCGGEVIDRWFHEYDSLQCDNCGIVFTLPQHGCGDELHQAFNRRAEPANEPPHYPGLYCKYNVFKVSDGSAVNDCFVLRPDRDPAAVFALRAYAAATANKSLADDIIGWVGKPDNPPLTLDELRGMDGEPVRIEEDGECQYGLVSLSGCALAPQYEVITLCSGDFYLMREMAGNFRVYPLAYRRKPEGEAQ